MTTFSGPQIAAEEDIPLTSYSAGQQRRPSSESALENGTLENQALLHDDAQTSHNNDFDGIKYPDVRGGNDTRFQRLLSCLRLSAPASSISTWIQGPRTPKPFRIKPYFADVQLAPILLRNRWLPNAGGRCTALCVYCCLWIVVSSLLLSQSLRSPMLPGTTSSPVRLSCTSRLWPNSTECGLDGDRCRPFDDDSFAFRCPANCKEVQILEPYAVGNQEVVYKSLVIGGYSLDNGNSVYRGDSFVCAAALHAGVIGDSSGGCGIVSRIGEQGDFPSTEEHGISSTGFQSYFPSSFTFEKQEDNTSSQCLDRRWQLLAISVIFTSGLSVLTSSSAVLFASTFTGIYFHVVFISDPPDYSNYYETISIAWERLLPAAFTATAIYYFCVRHTLHGLDAQLEKTILWLGGCWVGALDNYTFDRIPLSRLTPHDLKQQPGAIPALFIIVCVIAAIAIGQVWSFWREGRLPNYLKLYALMVVILLAFAAVPDMNLRIHHYILALLFLPGTALQTRPSMLYQGILLGLFINGVARWGFDSILQTPSQLLQGGQMNSALPVISGAETNGNFISFTFSKFAEGVGGISVLVNDVERFRSYGHESPQNFTWTRHKEGLPEFFRFGYTFRDQLGVSWYGDFTKAGIWAANDSWIPMEPGPSR